MILRADATEEDLAILLDSLQSRGHEIKVTKTEAGDIVRTIGPPDEDKELVGQQLQTYHFVERVVSIQKPYKIVSREFQPESTVIRVRDLEIGGQRIVVMAGPCTVESEEMLLETARAVKAAGASMLRGGAFKPSTSPYSFQGMGVDGLRLLARAREETGLPIVTEVMAVNMVEIVATYADMLQVGTRNMQNYPLLKEVGLAKRPVLLKRGMWATIEEWLQAAEYVASYGNTEIVLCERGIRTFETYTRNTFDINAIPAVKLLSHLPVAADPSHGTGVWRLVAPVAKAAVAAGADALIIEAHPRPSRALKDGFQSLTQENFTKLVAELRPVAQAVGREL
jgi:3-deoxy-7-phosphoheptulonate synthase